MEEVPEELRWMMSGIHGPVIFAMAEEAESEDSNFRLRLTKGFQLLGWLDRCRTAVVEHTK